MTVDAVAGGKSRKRSAASAAAWEDDDLIEDAGDALDLTTDDANVSTVGFPLIVPCLELHLSALDCISPPCAALSCMLFVTQIGVWNTIMSAARRLLKGRSAMLRVTGRIEAENHLHSIASRLCEALGHSFLGSIPLVPCLLVIYERMHATGLLQPRP